MSNSSFVSYTRRSPYTYGRRTHGIDTITPHVMAGQLSVETCGELFQKSGAASNYGIGSDGRIALYVDEEYAACTSSNKANDERAVTIEIASDSFAPYKITEAAYASLINLLEDICRRNNIEKLLWQNDKSLIGQVDKQNITLHRWFANKACPGDYLLSLYPQIAEHVNQRLSGTAIQNNMLEPLPASRADAGVNVEYAIASEKKWFPIVTNCEDRTENGYAGLDNVEACLVTARVSQGTLKTRVHPIGFRTYLPYVSGFNIFDNNNGFAGISGKKIDRIQFHLEGCPGKKVLYRVSVTGNKGWLPWVEDTKDYAGLPGRAIDKLQVKIV